MSAPTLVRLPDGSDIDGAALTCEGCGSPMNDHSCGGSGGGSVTFTSGSRSLGPRKPVSAHPTCAHCGGRVHFNMSATAVNSECLNRQYSLDKGEITDPSQRLPAMTLERMGEIFAWGTSLATPPTYGLMESSAGGAGTYAGLKPKTGRKKKTKPAEPGAQIQDMAEGEEIDVATEAKPKRGRKPKVSKLTVTEDGGETAIETVDLETAVAEAEADLASNSEPDEEAVQEAPISEAEAARQARAQRRAEQKARLARL